LKDAAFIVSKLVTQTIIWDYDYKSYRKEERSKIKNKKIYILLTKNF
jgi:hypothetical protein